MLIGVTPIRTHPTHARIRVLRERGKPDRRGSNDLRLSVVVAAAGSRKGFGLSLREHNGKEPRMVPGGFLVDFTPTKPVVTPLRVARANLDVISVKNNK